MKKRLLVFAIMIMAIVCLLAISVSAEGIKKFDTDAFQSGDNITYIEGINLSAYSVTETGGKAITELYDSSYVARIVVRNSDGTYTTYPTYYFIKLADDWQGDYQFITCDRINTMSDVTGETYNKNSIIRIEYPEYVENHTFGKMSGNVEKLDTFTSLKYVYVASHFTALNSSFDKCSALETVEFAPNSKLASVGQFSFRQTTTIQTLKFPNTLTTLSKEAIQTATNLSVLNLGASITTLKESNSLNGITSNDITIYLSRTIGSYSASFFPSKALVMFTGDEEQAKAFGFETTYSYDEWLKKGSPKGKIMVYGYNHCDAFYNSVHDLSGTGNCEEGLKCSRCDYKENALKHKISETVVYENGFRADGVWTYECTNADCTAVDKSETKKPIFTALEDNGYSINAYGTGIAFGGFVVNTEEFKLYNDLNENDITFGIFVANPKYVGETFMKDGEVNATSGFLKVDMTSDEYTNIKIMLDGFTGNAQNLELVISLYAIAGEDVEYIQSEHTVCANAKVTKSDATLYTVTLNSVANKPYKDMLDALPEYGKENEVA